MKIDTRKTVKTIGDQEIKLHREQQEGAPLKDILLFALSTMAERPTVEESAKIYLLGKKVDAGGEIDLDSDEVSLLKPRLVRVFPPFAFGAICDALEGRQ